MWHESNERCGIRSCENGVKCDIVEWVKRNSLRWFCYIERKNCGEFVKKVSVSE